MTQTGQDLLLAGVKRVLELLVPWGAMLPCKRTHRQEEADVPPAGKRHATATPSVEAASQHAATPRPTLRTPSVNKDNSALLSDSDDERSPWTASGAQPSAQPTAITPSLPSAPGALNSGGAMPSAAWPQWAAAWPLSGSATPSVRAKYDRSASREIGRGGNGTVVTARHVPSGETRALKIIDKRAMGPQRWSALEAEVSILQGLQHPNIVHLHEHFDDGEGNHVLVMEYLPGGELFDRLLAKTRAGAAYTEASCRRVIAQVLGAVAHYHQRGIVHRDLKPENL